ncbi:hypothetical protein [Afipia felis]|uniref:hypothetical protein n=1 Tax=Afipia felis TaxID=1035 RepID=UPI00065FEA21|nr:hypothetical protein [Afipia felis]
MSKNDNWHRRHAIQIAAQLPEDAKDALIVLDLAKSLVETFLDDKEDQAVLARRSLVAVPGGI